MTELKPTLSATSSCNFLSYSENRSSFSISPIIPSLFYRNSDLVSPQPSSNSKLLTKRKNLLEMMGYPSFCKSISPDIGSKSKKISLTDFMGNRKSSFLKQSGFIDIDKQYLKLELKKILESCAKFNKNSETKIGKGRNKSIEKNQNSNLMNSKGALNKGKSCLGLKLKRIQHCEDLIRMCNEMHPHTKSHRALSLYEKQVPKRNMKKRLSQFEKNSIINEIYKL